MPVTTRAQARAAISSKPKSHATKKRKRRSLTDAEINHIYDNIGALQPEKQQAAPPEPEKPETRPKKQTPETPPETRPKKQTQKKQKQRARQKWQDVSSTHFFSYGPARINKTRTHTRCTVNRHAQCVGTLTRLQLCQTVSLLDMLVRVEIETHAVHDARMWVTENTHHEHFFARVDGTRHVAHVRASGTMLYAGIMLMRPRKGDTLDVVRARAHVVRACDFVDKPLGRSARIVLMAFCGHQYDETFAALASLRTVHQAHFVGFRPIELETEVAAYIARTDFDAYIALFDDIVPSGPAVDTVCAALAQAHVFTGYCNVRAPPSNTAHSPTGFYAGSVTDTVPACYIDALGSERPLDMLPPDCLVSMLSGTPPAATPNVDELGFCTAAAAQQHHSAFGSMALTGMSRDAWLAFPFLSYKKDDFHGAYPDYHLSYRLGIAGLTLGTHPRAFCLKLRDARDVGSILPRGYLYGMRRVYEYGPGEFSAHDAYKPATEHTLLAYGSDAHIHI